MNTILISILLIVCISFIIMYINLIRNLNKICITLEQIYNGNYNQRIRMQTHNKILNNINGYINHILSDFQNTIEKKNYLQKTRKQMISNISHDLRTPLTSMLGYLEAIQKEDLLDDYEKEKYIKIAHNKANNLHNLMEEFFQLSKLESNDVVMNFEKINICAKVRELIASFYNDFIQRNLTPDITLPQSDLYVLGDHKAIERILNNLLSNSFKYVKENGQIGIEVFCKDYFTIIKMWNTGKGIEKSSLPYIFERLYTTEPSRNSKLQGSGLGLTIAKELVKKQNGKIYADSIPNDKTAFIVSLPSYR